MPRLVDLVHVFKGVVVEQFKKRLEKLFSDSILFWRLLKLLFKFLHPATHFCIETVPITPPPNTDCGLHNSKVTCITHYLYVVYHGLPLNPNFDDSPEVQMGNN